MKVFITASLLTLVLVQFAVSCKPREVNDRYDGSREARRQLAADNYLQGLLQTGASITNLISQFGAPAFQSEMPTKELCLTFYFPETNNAAALAGIAGFDALFVSNRLSRWLPIYVR
jgi:hypothetical protein